MKNQQGISQTNKYPKEVKNKCNSKMLQSILDQSNIDCGAKDDYYNDIISFERYFNEWDHDAIILSRWTWNLPNRRESERYVYFEKIGVYTDISILARSLQFLLPQEKIHVSLFSGEELTFTIYENDEYSKSTVYKCEFIDLNQRRPNKHYESNKLDDVYIEKHLK